ncbi:hypothetical protein L226DRAFT_565047 [Lentinus tigrinus ALCF2SS1-7]|uniref:ditrans,polycis-polyprenyl diphosphate synthase [(2E,6E)-farnesyldiphosphate specific] n=1 Tax=Lentinus tigrinus ALCF2SS1-6 TaxID=1328759 RepID=A0A5C2RXM8_9APHY|nr:hypothetical protein L227DRAFT_293355 [Lentinus tigrinus ALCF2SS1-6]RPD82480.1 hypothetical protein L226DRAFT_565047 [Lentinus tigrinus ALCF2SS1-7]
MSWFARLILAVLHVVYRLVLVFKSLSTRFRAQPSPLTAERSKLPSHLALSLSPNLAAGEESNEKYMLDSVEKVAGWCQVLGIRRLTVYDREGVLVNSSLDIRRRILPAQAEEADDSPVECDIRYPLTPPPSDDAESRPLSPHAHPIVPKLCVTTIRFPMPSSRSKRRASVSRTTLKRRRVARNDEHAEESPLTLHVVSYKSGKPAVAATATTLLRDHIHRKTSDVSTCISIDTSIQNLNAILEGEHGFPSPDLMIVHRKPPVGQMRSPVELGGFPPWQTRLTEIFCDPYPRATSWWVGSSSRVEPSSIKEAEFRRALDEFADAEMRLGK